MKLLRNKKGIIYINASYRRTILSNYVIFDNTKYDYSKKEFKNLKNKIIKGDYPERFLNNKDLHHFIKNNQMKFKAKTNDILYLFTKNASGKFIVEGFFAYGIKFKGTRIYPFFARSFYSCAYENNTAYFIVKKRWHYPFAIIIQFFLIKFFNILH